MKQLLKTVSVAALGFMMASAAQAGEAPVYDEKDLKKMIEDQGIYVETAKKGIVLSGYVDTSYTYQFAGKASFGQRTIREGGNNSLFPSTEAQGRAFDVDNNDFNINAFKLALEKALPDENTWAAGFRADLMFGEDAQILGGGSNATFDDASYLFLEQAYVQFRVPVGNGLDFKFGKFVTLLGYEVIESPANLNFSRSFLFQNAIPLTHTGFLMSYAFNDIIDMQLGLVNGWNNSDTGTGAFAIQGFGKAVTGQIAVHAPGGNATIANSFIYSADGEPLAGNGFTENQDVFTWDIWGQWAPRFANDKLLLAFNADLGFADHAQLDSFFGPARQNSDTWYGVALYAKYQFTPMFSLAGRGEYFRDNGGLKAFGTPGGAAIAPGSVVSTSNLETWSWTVTASFDIWENLLLRLEYRYDLFNEGDYTPITSSNSELDDLSLFGLQENNDQHQIALNLVYTF